jgi:hypothetical protein
MEFAPADFVSALAENTTPKEGMQSIRFMKQVAQFSRHRQKFTTLKTKSS